MSFNKNSFVTFLTLIKRSKVEINYIVCEFHLFLLQLRSLGLFLLLDFLAICCNCLNKCLET